VRRKGYVSVAYIRCGVNAGLFGDMNTFKTIMHVE
jgi:hypothetical protein